MEKITILITDDHMLIRQTWSFLLNADPRFKVVAEAANGRKHWDWLLNYTRIL